jgi:hypothetical protein
MAQASTAVKTTKPAAAPAGAMPTRLARSESPGSLGRVPTGTGVPRVLSPEVFEEIGHALNGRHWQADVAALIGCSKSQVTRYLKKSEDPKNHRDLSPVVAAHLQYVIAERIRLLAEMMTRPGMPYADTPDVVQARETIEAVVGKLPGREPPGNS